MHLGVNLSNALQQLESVKAAVDQSDDPKLKAATNDDLNMLISLLESPILKSIATLQDSVGMLATQVAHHPSILPGDFDITPAGELALQTRNLYGAHEGEEEQRVPQVSPPHCLEFGSGSDNERIMGLDSASIDSNMSPKQYVSIMALDSSDKLSIKHLLFTKAIPNYVIPEATAGYKTYPCIDCGDRFLFQSSYDYHVNRKSVLITYMCRHCNLVRTFTNRCKLLSHIRSHAFKTATINVSDLKVDPLPSSYFDSLAAKHSNVQNSDKEKTAETPEPRKNTHPSKGVKKVGKFCCLECRKEVPATSQLFKDRANHFMQYTNKVHACPVCLFALPTMCGLKTHLRLHTSSPPYYCPECGIGLSKRMIQYPYTHDCEGFRMMRATARYKCPLEGCYLFHPNEYKAHMKNNHIKKVYKCPMCVVACFNETTIAKHLASHQTEAKAVIFFQCEMCPGRLVLQTQMDNHLRGHITNSAFVYPCWACGQIFREVRILLKHYSYTHSQTTKLIAIEGSVPKPAPGASQKEADKSGITYRVVKRCDKCKRSFTYKCKYEQIAILPNECPFKCAASKESTAQITAEESPVDENPTEVTIKCHLCKKDVSENWEELKKHYASDHKNIQCLDARLILNKIDVKKYNRKKRKAAQRRLKRALKKHRGYKVSQLTTSHPPIMDIVSTPSCSSHSDNPLACKKCGHESESREMLEEHLMTHRDPGMAYQCMECGQCFAVKPSFTTHLLVQHGISEVDKYVNDKHCYNADALLKNNFTIEKCEIDEPLRENQCQICRDQFDNTEDLEKHFRVHGMAFLMKNSSNKTNSP